LTFRTLLLLGVTGGIVPCPTATIILLLGIGANVVLGALYAVGIFSLGLALTLMVIGFLALSSRRFAARVLSDARHEGELSTRGQKLLLQALPAVSGAVVFALGAAISANYVYYLLNGTALVRWLG
jgi:ABC-type nickel/cobalt efflux system permease component RcnA